MSCRRLRGRTEHHACDPSRTDGPPCSVSRCVHGEVSNVVRCACASLPSFLQSQPDRVGACRMVEHSARTDAGLVSENAFAAGFAASASSRLLALQSTDAWKA